MQLSLQTFTTLVQNMAAAVQSAASQLLDLSVGSVVRAVLEANASIALWMQWLILQVLQTTRAASSNGADLDSWMADMSLTRLPAVAASGSVTLSRFTPTSAALVPVGALVRTADGTQTYAVTADPTNPAWSASQNGFAVPAGIASVTVPVLDTATGAAGNVQPGTITLLASAIPGIDSVTNAGALVNGIDPESDAAFRARFQNFINSRSRATLLAVGYAITSIQQGIGYTIAENVDTAGDTRMGSFVVTIDNGSGDAPATLLATVMTAVEAVRPVGSTFAVQAAVALPANIALTLTIAPSGTLAQITGEVAAAISAYVNTLAIGAPLPLTKIAQLAYSAEPLIANVSGILINGMAADLVPPISSVIKTGIISVN